MPLPVEYEPCTAKSKQSGERCKRRPRAGLTVCSVHGGKAPRADAIVRQVKALRGMDRLKSPTVAIVDPLTSLLDVAARAVRLMGVMEEQTSALQAMRYATGAGEQTRAELHAYERSLDRCAKVLGDIVRLGIDERMARVSELQAGLLVAALDAGMRAAGLTEGSPQWRSARKEAARSLRSVTMKRVE